MPWFKIDDAFHGHPKVMELSPAAVGIWTLAGSWCANYLTDGEIKASIVRRLGADDSMVQELVDAGLWIDLGGAYQFKDWGDYQPLKADVEAERDAARERMKAVRAKKKGVERSAEQPPNVQPNNPGTFAGTSEEVRSTPTQSRPDQTEEAKASSSRSKRGTRIPADFTVTPDMIAWAQEKAANVDGPRETAKFINYYQGIAGAKGVKLDWVATWRNWMLNAAERAPNTKPTTGDKMRDTFARGQALQERLNNTGQTILEIGA